MFEQADIKRMAEDIVDSRPGHVLGGACIPFIDVPQRVLVPDKLQRRKIEAPAVEKVNRTDQVIKRILR